MQKVAFDAKEFRRYTWVDEDGVRVDEAKAVSKKEFYTPLGVGVCFKEDLSQFKRDFDSTLKTICGNFPFSLDRPMYSSRALIELVDKRAAIPFCDQLVSNLQNYIERIHISYAVLSPKDVSEVKVGGSTSLSEQIPRNEFLRKLNPMFSYIAAWNYLGKDRPSNYEIYIDSFSSKHTPAWNDLLRRTTPKVFPRGDECNPFINIADVVAFLTDTKLYGAKLFLKPDNIEKIWKNYSFETEVHFLDDRVLSKYKWFDTKMINISEYLARPMTFVLVDRIENIANLHLFEPDEEMTPELLNRKESSHPRKFRKTIQKMMPYFAACKNAYQVDGGVEFFDVSLHTEHVRDGDFMIYIGKDSKRIAETFRDAYDVKVISAKELRKNLKMQQ